ncbi:MAG: hypothetical protein II842_10560 [Butyrivibrio sp.]|nr:hypothetical protein [Butyrivibrio sp.]
MTLKEAYKILGVSKENTKRFERYPGIKWESDKRTGKAVVARRSLR